MIEVKDKNNNIRCTVEITDKCVYCKTLMEEEYVLLSFESDTLVGFAKKDYIVTEFGTFRIMEVTKPEPQSDGGYLYEQKFVPDWMFWKNRILFYNRQLGYEKSWKMTQRPEYFMDIVVSNLQDAGFGTYSFEIDETLTEMKLVEFDSANIIDALTAIAEAWETEWWITDTVIHLSKCEFGSPVSLTEGDELGDIERDEGQDTTYLTRAYVFGSTRNLPKNYRKNDDGTVVVDGVVETRLKLPEGTPYVDAWENMKDEDIVEGVIVLDDVYPRNVGTMSIVTTKEYTDEIENEDGTKTYETWNAYRFMDATLPHFSKEYVLTDQELHIIFQTGKLAGMDFAVTFNPNSESEKDTASQIFEIVRNDDYGVDLPTDTFKPEVGDTYILYGYDTSYVYDNLVSKAEQELYEKAIEEVADASKDKSVYTCPTNPLRCAGYKPNSIGKMIHTTADEIDFEVGQSVTLRSTNQFESGYRLSRVRGFEKRLDNKFNCTYTIGESSAYSRSADLQEQVDALTYQSKQFVNVYGNSVYVVKRYDTTAPSDSNVPSFKRAQYEFLQRNVPNRAVSTIGFDEGIEIGSANSEGVSAYTIKADGTAVLKDIRSGGDVSVEGTSVLEGDVTFGGKTVPFVAGAQGGRVSVDGDGVKMQVDYLEVTRKMTAHEIEVMRTSHIGGRLMNTAASMVCSRVETLTDTDGNPTAYVCFFEDTDSDGRQVDNLFRVGDQALCQTFNIKEGTTSEFENQYYWRLVTAVEYTTTEDMTVNGRTYASGTTLTNCVVLSATDCATGSTAPMAGDEIVQLGSRTEKDRQGAIIQSSTGTAGETPYMRCYKGIDSYTLPEPFFQISPDESWINATQVSIKAEGESGVTVLQYFNNMVDQSKDYTDGKASESKDYTDTKVESVASAISKVEEQMDESFYVWHGEDTTAPTLDTLPASDWTTEDERAEHIGDFYVSSDGMCWQFRQDADFNHIWAEVNDRYLTAYVSQIGEKRRVFVSQPTVNAVYDVGDLWANASYSGKDTEGNTVVYSNDLLVCVTAKAQGELFYIDHWEPSSGVTVESVAKAVSEVREEAESLWAGTELKYKDADGNWHVIEKAGLMTTSNFAQLVAENEDVSAALGVCVEDGVSKAKIKAQQVEILSDHFKVLNGDVYADSLTLTGTFNKMLTVVTAQGLQDAAEAPRTCQLDGSQRLYNSPDWLLTGELVHFSTGAMTHVNLPFYAHTPDKECAPSVGGPSPFRYVRTPTRFGTGEWHMMTLAEMQMMVGKKLYLTNTNKTGNIIVYYGIPFITAYSGDLEYITWDGKNDYASIGIPPGRTLVMECRLDGYFSTDKAYYECIWWKQLADVGQPLEEFTDTAEDES